MILTIRAVFFLKFKVEWFKSDRKNRFCFIMIYDNTGASTESIVIYIFNARACTSHGRVHPRR